MKELTLEQRIGLENLLTELWVKNKPKNYFIFIKLLNEYGKQGYKIEDYFNELLLYTQFAYSQKFRFGK